MEACCTILNSYLCIRQAGVLSCTVIVNSNKMCGDLKRSPDHLSAGSSSDGVFEAIQTMAVYYLCDQEDLILTGTLSQRYFKHAKFGTRLKPCF